MPPPEPTPPTLSFGEWAYTSRFLNARVKRFQLVAMIFLPNGCHFSLQSFSPSPSSPLHHFNTLARKNSGAFVQFLEMRMWCLISPTWLRERLVLAGGSNIRGQQVRLLERWRCLWHWLQLCPSVWARGEREALRTPRGRRLSPERNSRYPLSSLIQMWVFVRQVEQSDDGARGRFLSSQVPCVSAESRPRSPSGSAGGGRAAVTS